VTWRALYVRPYALDVRLLLGGALYPILQHSGLHITLVLMILIGFSYGTRDINPYLNKVGCSCMSTILNPL
jgi:hypothetical protein